VKSVKVTDLHLTLQWWCHYGSEVRLLLQIKKKKKTKKKKEIQ